jgi:hypothetical protein
MIKDFVTVSQQIKDNNIQKSIDQITAAVERLNFQLDNINWAFGTDKITMYTQSLNLLRDAGVELEKDFNKLRKNEHREFKIDFDTVSIERLQEIIVQITKIQHDGDKKSQKVYQERIDQLMKMIDLKQKELDIENKMREAVTGTTADSITDAIVQGFEDGYSTVQDFGKSFEDIMKKAILNSFKMKMIEPYMNTYFAELSKAMTDGTITDEENKYLRIKWDAFLGKITVGMDKVDQMFNDFGYGVAVESQKGLAGAIKGITEDTAGVLAGTMNSMRLNGVQQLQVAQSGLITLQKIEANTKFTQYVFEVLKRMEGKMNVGSQFTSNRASGR